MSKSDNAPDPADSSPEYEAMIPSAERALLPNSSGSPLPQSAMVGDMWMGMGGSEFPSQPASNNLSNYLHAFRRRWLLAGFLGALCAVAAAAAVFVSKKPAYTASAMLYISPQQESLLFDIGDAASRSNFDSYKRTQQQLIKSNFVLIAALRDPQIGNLAVVREEPDPVRYLTEELRVDFPGESELMTVRLTCEDPAAASSLVNAVVQAYMDEVVDREKQSRQARMKELDDLYTAKAEEVRTKRIELKNLADELGTGDMGALALAQQFALEQFATFRREAVSAQFEVRKIQGELKVKQAQLEKLEELEKSGEAGIDDADVKFALRTDASSIDLLTLQARLEGQISEHEGRSVASSSPILDKLRKDLEQVNNLLIERETAIREELQQRRRRELETRIAELSSQLAVATEQQQQLEKDLEASRTKAESVGGSSIDVEIMRSDITRLENDIIDPVAEERERLRVELETPSRVQLFQAAAKPTLPDDDNFAMKLIMAALVGFGLPFAGILYLDTRKQRVNGPSDVTRAVGIKVLGTTPPFRPARRSNQLVHRSRRGQQQVREAVNGIIARLLHEIQHDESHVVLVTSATSGEGKTTLSTQLATGLAHIGYKTLLVDFDLRRPSLSRLFGGPAAPGVSELLRGETTLEATFHETDIENLTLIPAGEWISRAFAILANGTTRSFFEQLREQFDFVIVDGSPVLPVAESRMVARYADRVLLSVLRDVSCAPQVLSAWQTLSAFGSKSIEAVVTGFSEDVYYEQREPVPAAALEVESSAPVESP